MPKKASEFFRKPSRAAVAANELIRVGGLGGESRGYSLLGNDESGTGAVDMMDGGEDSGNAGHHTEHFDRGRGRCSWLIGRCVCLINCT